MGSATWQSGEELHTRSAGAVLRHTRSAQAEGGETKVSGGAQRAEEWSRGRDQRGGGAQAVVELGEAGPAQHQPPIPEKPLGNYGECRSRLKRGKTPPCLPRV